MATVYQAQHVGTGETCAIKVLPAHVSHAPQRLTRFKREIALALRFDHPHIVSVFDAGCVDDTQFLAMEYLPLGSLAYEMRERLLRHEAFSVVESVEIARQIALALAYAHEQGIIHRDVTPGNILCARRDHRADTRDGAVRDRLCYKLGDFGLALEEGVTRLSLAGGIGTVDYVSPEAVLPDARVDARSDIYSLGVVLYEMLSGRPLFAAEHPLAKLHKLVNESHVPLCEIRADVPKALHALVERALAKHPAKRFPTADAFAQALEQFQARSARRLHSTRRHIRWPDFGHPWLKRRFSQPRSPIKPRLSTRIHPPRHFRWVLGLAAVFLSFAVLAMSQPLATRAIWPRIQNLFALSRAVLAQSQPALGADPPHTPALSATGSPDLVSTATLRSEELRSTPSNTISDTADVSSLADDSNTESLAASQAPALLVSNVTNATVLTRRYPNVAARVMAGSQMRPGQRRAVLGRSVDQRWWLVALDGDRTGWVPASAMRTFGDESAVPIVIVVVGSP
ncbi:MAG: protein kinase [Anaerolineae bacterium]|nr:protein kinase [Anaerolineae bacterium]